MIFYCLAQVTSYIVRDVLQVQTHVRSREGSAAWQAQYTLQREEGADDRSGGLTGRVLFGGARQAFMAQLNMTVLTGTPAGQQVLLSGACTAQHSTAQHSTAQHRLQNRFWLKHKANLFVNQEARTKANRGK